MKKIIKKSEFSNGFQHDEKYYEIYKNPTRDESNIVKDQDSNSGIRGIIELSGDIYIWAADVLHGELPYEYFGIHFDFDGSFVSFHFDGECTQENIFHNLTSTESKLNILGIGRDTRCGFDTITSDKEVQELLDEYFYKFTTYGEALSFMKKNSRVEGVNNMKRLIKQAQEQNWDDWFQDHNYYIWTREMIDGFVECECGQKIDGKQMYDNYGGNFYCQDCYEKIKNQKMKEAYLKHMNIKRAELYDTVLDDMSYYEIYKNPTNDELSRIKRDVAMVIQSDGTIYAWDGGLGIEGINSFFNDHSMDINTVGDLNFIFRNGDFNIKGTNKQDIVNKIFKYENILSQINNLKLSYFNFIDLDEEWEYDELIKERELMRVSKKRDRGEDGEIINHMETSTRGKTLFAHRLLHMWYKNTSKTNWTKEQIIDEHIKVVEAMFDKDINHNIVDALDTTLPKYLQNKSNKK